MTARRTEAQHAQAKGLQAEAPLTVLARLHDSQREAAGAVAPALPALAAAAEVAAAALRAGRRLAYAGAGSSGLMALADALELAGTFGIPPPQAPVLFAGGAAALLDHSGASEDEVESAAADFRRVGLGAGDVLICVAASGTTPYTVAIAEAGRAAGATIVAIANVADSPLLAVADISVLLDTGPELVAGSTRLGAATAQKIALNLISTLAGLRLGHVYDGYMVNMVAANAKLRDRAARIVAAIAGCDEAAARAALAATGGAVKPAVLVAAGAQGRAEADRLLAASEGHLGPALNQLHSGR
ncbi:MAG TPA: N-acetylmuramic acid 6-phosphate etherase [Paracoccaceae bacterium]|nr:N-acetylmuramic acid 6-phosphate etherase [Paracoccaceae bacterium]